MFNLAYTIYIFQKEPTFCFSPKDHQDERLLDTNKAEQVLDQGEFKDHELHHRVSTFTQVFTLLDCEQSYF